MINVIENKDYRNLQNDYYDGESFVYFDIIQVDAENDNITVMVSHQGKLAMRTFELKCGKSLWQTHNRNRLLT